MIVTGQTDNSRVVEFRKYAVNVPFNQQYVGGGSLTSDGVDFTNSISGVTMTYYIGGIKYVDDVSGGTTTFEYTPLGTSSPDFISVPYYKDPKKENIISNPKINDDVFIVRQNISVFENNYRLEYIKNLSDLQTYVGGNFFNIVNNS